MAEFLTQEDADKKYGKKGRTNAALTLGIIGTALGAFNNNGGGDGCCCGGGGNNGGILGGLLGGNRGNNGCCCAMKEAQQAKTMAMAQGQQADNLAWANRVQSMQDDMDLYTYVSNRDMFLNTEDWNNRVKSMQDDFDIHTRSVNRDIALGDKIANESQILTNQIWKGRVEDLGEKFDLYTRGVERDNALKNQICDNRATDLQEKFDIYARSVASDNAINARICAAENAEKDDKFFLYTQSTQADSALDNKFMKIGYENRIADLNEKFDLYTRLNNKITELEKQQATTATALPLMFELSKCGSERYTDACCCSADKKMLIMDNNLQRQLDHKIDGQLKYEYSNLCAPVPNISPLYCSPFTTYGSGTTWTGCCQNQNTNPCPCL